MLETKDLYKDYISSIQDRINLVTIKISQYLGSQEYLRNCIVNNRAEFEKINVNIDTLFANPHIAYAKIKGLVDNGQLTRVGHYVKSYVSSLNYLTLHKLLFERLNKCLMPYEVYLKILGYSNLEIAAHIVKGGYYSFGNVGKLFILEKARTFLFRGIPTKLPIDWGSSNKYKQELLNTDRLPYSKTKAPTGIKWHVYHNSDFAYWFWWEKGPVTNRGFFRFTPTMFNRRYNKKDIPFKTKDEVYNTTDIGILNKMLTLMKLDPLHYLNYQRPEKRVKVEEQIVNFINK